MPAPLTEKLIQRQINNWNKFREFLPDPDAPALAPRGPIITISRQTGSGGRQLATTLATRLDMKIHDQSLVEKIARDSNLEKEVIADLDENEISQARLWIKGVLNQRIFLRNQYHMALIKVVSGLAAKGNAIFLGRGANLILGSHATLRIRLVASYQSRLKNILSRTNLSRAEARILLEETDRKRSQFIRQIFREEPGNPESYDLVMNTDRMHPECLVEVAMLALLDQQAGGMRTPAEEKTARA